MRADGVISVSFIRVLAWLAVMLSLAACSSSVIRINYHSEPQGALITTTDSILPLGRAPVLKAYPLDSLPEPDENGCIIIPGAEALWDSGATTRVGGLRICDLKQKTFGIDLPRPTGYPDLEIDLEVAIRRGRRLATERERWFFSGVEPPRSNPTGIRDH